MGKKVTVITLQNVRNYGSVLQALATQQIFKQLGCDVDFINYNKNGKYSYLDRVFLIPRGRVLLLKSFIPLS